MKKFCVLILMCMLLLSGCSTADTISEESTKQETVVETTSGEPAKQETVVETTSGEPAKQETVVETTSGEPADQGVAMDNVHHETPVQFAAAYNYGNKIYARDWSRRGGGITCFRKDDNIIFLSERIPDNLSVLSLCVYKDKIYFLEGNAGPMSVPANIYSCNLDGSNLKMIVEDAENGAKITIVDNILYYAPYDSYHGDIRGYVGGICSINLKDLSVEKICDDRDTTIYYCDGEYIYYGGYSDINNDSYAEYVIRTNGTDKKPANKNDDVFLADVYVKGNDVYYMEKNNLYVRRKGSTNGTCIGTIPENKDFDYSIIAVTEDAVLCSGGIFIPGREGYDILYRFNR